MKSLKRLCAFAVLSVCPLLAHANSTKFVLENRSSEPIFGIFISPVQATGWGSDYLGSEVLMPKYEQNFNVGTARGCVYDIRVRYKSQRTEEKRNLNLCNLNRVVFTGSAATAPAATPSAQRSQTPSAPAPRPASAYDGSTPLRCGGTVNCRSQAEVVQKMQLRWNQFSRATHYSSTCLDAIRRIRTMNPAAYGDGNAGWVQPQMDICNLR